MQLVQRCEWRRPREREFGSDQVGTMSENDGTQSQNTASKYAKTGIDKNRMQIEKLMKDPSKPVVLPAAPKEKTVRPPREMIKNVQGSSAGAGSGEFHVYKASRRREYERLKIMEDQKAKVSTGLFQETIFTRLNVRLNG
jgi:hypothetical protein